MNSIILSPIGTSLFTKGAFPPQISRYSNCHRQEDIPDEHRDCVVSWVEQTKELFASLTPDEARIRSAEMNGIVQYYNGSLTDAGKDTHYLLPSDTYIGKEACKIVESYLANYCDDIRILEVKDIQTGDCASFQYALSDLTGRIMTIKEGILPGRKLIFNLTGGFKAILGFLQSLGMFYADETVYVFEFSESLMRIPPLPLKLEPYPYLLDFACEFRRLDKNLSVKEEVCAQIPASLVLNLFGEPTLSAYGKIVWDSFRKQIYSQKMLDSISEKISYSAQFKETTQNLNSEAYYNLNRRIDDLAVYLENNRKNMPKSLDLKSLKLAQGICTHEFDAWADRDAKRVFCHFEGDLLILDKLSKKLQ